MYDYNVGLEVLGLVYWRSYMPSPLDWTVIRWAQPIQWDNDAWTGPHDPLDWQTIVWAHLYVIKGMQNAPPDHQAIIK